MFEEKNLVEEFMNLNYDELKDIQQEILELIEKINEIEIKGEME